MLLTVWQCTEDNNQITQNVLSDAEITGTVIDQKTLLPIDSVKIELIPETQEFYTDTAGNFAISNLESGFFLLIFSKLGYLLDSLQIYLGQTQDTVILMQLYHDPAFAEMSLRTSKNYYEFNENGLTLIPYYFKNNTDSIAYYGKCGSLPIYSTCSKDSGDWICSDSFWGSPCLAIYLWKTITLPPYSITHDTLYVTSKDTFRFIIEIKYDTKTDRLISNDFIVQ